MSLIAGTYTFERQSNFQNYLKELGVPYVLRTLAGIARPVVTVSRDCQVRGHTERAYYLSQGFEDNVLGSSPG